MRRVKAELAEEWSLEIEIYYKNFTKGSCSSTKKNSVQTSVMKDGEQL